MRQTLFLRRVLAFDSLSCLGLGLALGTGAAALAPSFGLPQPLLRAAGLLLLPLAAFIGWLAARPAPPRALVWIVILGNLGWSAQSLATIIQAQGAITPLGTAFVAAQALAVLGLAGLQYAGLRKAAAAA